MGLWKTGQMCYISGSFKHIDEFCVYNVAQGYGSILSANGGGFVMVANVLFEFANTRSETGVVLDKSDLYRVYCRRFTLLYMAIFSGDDANPTPTNHLKLFPEILS